MALIVLLTTACNGSTNGRENDLAQTGEPPARSVTVTHTADRIFPLTPTSAGHRDRAPATSEPAGSVDQPVALATRYSSTATRPSPTPTLHREWTVQEIMADGGTVTVDMHVYAAVDVRAKLGGLEPDLVERADGTLRHVFHYVPAGRHEVVVSDVMGFSESIHVAVSGPPPCSGAGDHPD